MVRGRSSVTSSFPTLPRPNGRRATRRPPGPPGSTCLWWSAPPPGTSSPTSPASRSRVFGWLDLAGRDPMVDPVAVGTVVAAVHRVRHDAGIPVHPWYSDPVGAAAWDDLVAALSAAGAPFSDELAAYRDELVAMEGLLEPASRLQTCHRDLWADNILGTDDGLCVIDWENCGLADPSQELAMVLFEFGMGTGSDPCHSRRLRRSRGAGAGRTSRHVLDGHRHSGPHRVPARPAVARSRRRARSCRRRHGGVSRRTAADGRRGHVHPRRRHRRLTRPRRQSSGSRGVGGRVSSRARSEH